MKNKDIETAVTSKYENGDYGCHIQFLVGVFIVVTCFCSCDHRTTKRNSGSWRSRATLQGLFEEGGRNFARRKTYNTHTLRIPTFPRRKGTITLVNSIKQAL